jgi:benzoyl-CoA reductase subunit C
MFHNKTKSKEKIRIKGERGKSMIPNNTKLMEDFKEVVENRHEYAKRWTTRTGGKVCGLLSNMVPEEYLYAANVLPVRILPDATRTPTLVSDHIQANRCACCHGSLEEGLRGSYDYLDGLVYMQTCIAQSLVFSSWVMHVPTAWHYKMFGPWREIPSAESLYQSYIEDYKAAIEKWCGVSISEEALREAVSVFKENRVLLSNLYELRKKHPPLIKGSEAQQIVLAGMLMDKKEHNELLRQVLKQAENAQEQGDKKDEPVRVMIVGSGISPMDLIKLVESMGAEVVVEDHCLGLRYFWDKEQGTHTDHEKPEEAIMAYYRTRRAKCVFQEWMGDETKLRLKNLVTDYSVDAVVWLVQAFCGTWQWIIPEGLSTLESMGVPVLKLERGRVLIKGRVQPQLEAFLSQVKK